MIKEFSGSFLLRQWSGPRASLPITADEVVGLAHVNYAVGNYYHWLIDSLPRLLVLQRHYPACPLLVPAPVPAYVKQTALMFGFDRLLPLDRGVVAAVSQLAMPDYVSEPGSQDPALVKEVRETILNSLNLMPSKSHRRIFVSRNQQPIRRLSNEEAIEPILRQYGFESVSFEGMSFEDQVRTMQDAAVLVGVHGANLTNMLFMTPQTVVVELMNENTLVLNDCYYCLASALNLAYYNLPCQRIVKPGLYDSNDLDLVIDPEALRQLLHRLITPF
ncbi:glycosyltransferase family 61 protein [Hymenobacter terrenus]|uniref:glycosyltransferase family 61 protein n=1 Tax=Hymenobacter terrenus TaxID=1629124 RepID=UPI0018CFE4F0|nr:glycosyltransferase family 61 protein [Hymenobacter terrenus]